MTPGAAVEPPLSEQIAPPGPYVPTALPKWDVLRRLRLPSIQGMELEYREAPDLPWSEESIAGALAVAISGCAFAANSLFLGPVLRTGDVPWTALYPLWLGLGFLLAVYGILQKAPWQLIVVGLAGPAACSVLLELAYGGMLLGRVALAAVLALTLSVLADCIITYYVHWLTADAQLSVKSARALRVQWGARFSPRSVLFRGYVLGAVIPLYCCTLGVVRCPSWLALLSAIFATGILVSVAPPGATGKNLRQAGELVREDVLKWLNFGRWQGLLAEPTPGLFVGPCGPAVLRWLFTGLVFFVISALFVPPVTDWAADPWPALLNVVCGVLLPAVMVVCAVTASGVSALTWARAEVIRAIGQRPDRPANAWESYVDRLEKSRHPLEREHMWLGAHREAGYPVLLHNKILAEHGHVIGDSGSGKTARGITPLLVQVIRRGGGGVVIIDLKGDMAMFEAARLEAKRCNRTFKYFTNVLGRGTYVFNPYQQTNSDTVSISQFVETMMESLRLNHGEGYGARFFSSQGRDWLLSTVKNFPNMESFEELAEKTTMDFFANQAERDRCLEVISVIKQVAEVQALNWRPKEGDSSKILEDAIFMPDVVAKEQVVYFWLPAAGEAVTVREIANLTLYALFQAAGEHFNSSAVDERKQNYLFIDEFQRMASAGFQLILQQARSFGLGVVLANQTVADLRTDDAPTLLNVVRGNTRFRQYFSASDPLTEEVLVKGSGETLYVQADGERIGPRFTASDVKLYSSEEQTSMVEITRDSGYSCFGGHWFAVKSGFHIDQAEYDKRRNAQWPTGDRGTIVARRENGSLKVSPAMEPASQVSNVVPRRAAVPSGVVEAPGPARAKSTWAPRLADIYRKRMAELAGKGASSGEGK